MQIELQRSEGVVLASLQGRFDAYGAEEFGQCLRKASLPGAESLVLDLSRVEYLSSAGLRVILATYKKLNRAGGLLALAGLQPYCRSVLDFTGFAQTFPVFETTAEAVAFCERGRSRSAREEESLPAGVRSLDHHSALPLSPAPSKC